MKLKIKNQNLFKYNKSAGFFVTVITWRAGELVIAEGKYLIFSRTDHYLFPTFFILLKSHVFDGYDEER